KVENALQEIFAGQVLPWCRPDVLNDEVTRLAESFVLPDESLAGKQPLRPHHHALLVVADDPGSLLDLLGQTRSGPAVPRRIDAAGRWGGGAGTAGGHRPAVARMLPTTACDSLLAAQLHVKDVLTRLDLEAEAGGLRVAVARRDRHGGGLALLPTL